jgi:UDP-glucose 4-epimerase
MRVLVTGGAGYVGSIVVEELLAQEQIPVVYDNLSKGHRQSVAPGVEFIHGELLDQPRLERALLGFNIEAVIHMAADSLVGESFQNPVKYYANNVVAGLCLLEAMRSARVGRIYFLRRQRCMVKRKESRFERVLSPCQPILTGRRSSPLKELYDGMSRRTVCYT